MMLLSACWSFVRQLWVEVTYSCWCSTDIYQLCPGRTLSSDNAYLKIIPIAASCKGVLDALLTLSASYRKEYCPDRHEVIQQRETECKMETVRWLTNHIRSSEHTLPCLLVIMLLVHHCMVNEDGDHCWSVHLKAISGPISWSPTPSFPSLFAACQVVLASTACSLTDSRLPLSYEYQWLGSASSDELTRIDGTIGTSRAVLYIMNSITLSSGVGVRLVPITLMWFWLIILDNGNADPTGAWPGLSAWSDPPHVAWGRFGSRSNIGKDCGILPNCGPAVFALQASRVSPRIVYPVNSTDPVQVHSNTWRGCQSSFTLVSYHNWASPRGTTIHSHPSSLVYVHSCGNCKPSEWPIDYLWSSQCDQHQEQGGRIPRIICESEKWNY